METEISNIEIEIGIENRGMKGEIKAMKIKLNGMGVEINNMGIESSNMGIEISIMGVEINSMAIEPSGTEVKVRIEIRESSLGIEMISMKKMTIGIRIGMATRITGISIGTGNGNLKMTGAMNKKKMEHQELINQLRRRVHGMMIMKFHHIILLLNLLLLLLLLPPPAALLLLVVVVVVVL